MRKPMSVDALRAQSDRCTRGLTHRRSRHSVRRVTASRCDDLSRVVDRMDGANREPVGSKEVGRPLVAPARGSMLQVSWTYVEMRWRR